MKPCPHDAPDKPCPLCHPAPTAIAGRAPGPMDIRPLSLSERLQLFFFGLGAFALCIGGIGLLLWAIFKMAVWATAS